MSENNQPPNSPNGSPDSNSTPRSDDDADLLFRLWRRFPTAGYLLGMLPQHSFGSQFNPASSLPFSPPLYASHLPSFSAGSQPHTQMYHPPMPPPPHPYSPAARQAPGASATPSTTHQSTTGLQPTSIHVSVPRNTGVPNAEENRISLTLPVDLPYVDFVDRVCANMDLHPSTAQLGYKYHTDRVREPPHRLANEADLREAMDIGIGLTTRARTRRIIMEIHNLTVPVVAPPANGNSRKKRRGQDHGDQPEGLGDLDTTLSFTRELRALRERLRCAAHGGSYCRVNPFNREHIPLNVFEQTLWAKKIFLGEATLTEPPNTLNFDRAPKKRRQAEATSSAQPMPVIHLHLPSFTSAAPTVSPVIDLTQDSPKAETHDVPMSNATPVAATNTASVTASKAASVTASKAAAVAASDAASVAASVSQPLPVAAEATLTHVYPSVYHFLSLLDDIQPSLGFPRFEPILRSYGYTSLTQLEHIPYDFLVHTVGMPGHAVDVFLEEARSTVGRIRKGKAPAPSVKVEEMEESLGNDEEDASSHGEGSD